MKGPLAALLLLSFVVVLLPISVHATTDPASRCSPVTCSVAVQRMISTNPWGVTIVTDSVNLNATVPVANLTIGFPDNMSDGLRSSMATSGSLNLQVSSLGTSMIPSGPGAGKDFTTLSVGFPRPENGTFSFNLTTIYTGLVSFSSTANSFAFQVAPFFLSDNSYKVSSAGVTIKTGDWPSPQIQQLNKTVTGGSYTVQAVIPYAAYNTTTWRVNFSPAGTKQNLFDVSAGRVIDISSTGSVQTTDEYDITNLGPSQSSISFTVPKAVSGISESYVLGLQIDQPSTTPTPTANPDGTSTVTFTPSFGSLSYNQSVKVKISYLLSPSSYISAGSLGTFTLNFALFNNVQFYESSLQTKIMTPMGFRLDSLTGQVAQSTGSQITIQVSPVTPLSVLGFSMSYQLDPFWASLSPLSWVSLIELALAASVIAVWKGPGVVAGLTGAPSQLITLFVDLYDEKSALRLESDKMEEDIGKGTMNRYDYKQRRRSIDRQMTEIDRQLAPVKDQLSAVEARYQDMIKRIERAEAELQVVRATSADLRSQYRTGKLSRDLFESLNADLLRRKERTQRTIDTTIINLREEIR